MSFSIGHTIVSVRNTASTNNYAIQQSSGNEVKEGTVFLAYEQTAGRGQLNNHWESEPGKNLTFSIVLNPDFLPVHQQFMLSKVICLGISSLLEQHVPEVKIKWPNDIYAGDQKICGILIENAVMNGVIVQSVIGVGLNVNQVLFLSSAPNPVSLKMITGTDHDPDAVLAGILRETDRFYRKLKSGRSRELDREFLDKLYQFGIRRKFRDPEHVYEGRIIGVNEIGQLLVREADGPVHAYHFKEVEYGQATD